MKLKALFDFPPWAKGEEFEVDDVVGKALIDAQYAHFEMIVPEPVYPEPVVDIDPWPAPLPAAAAVDAPPADKMIHKPRRKK